MDLSLLNYKVTYIQTFHSQIFFTQKDKKNKKYTSASKFCVY
jgi:hypothetical protein